MFDGKLLPCKECGEYPKYYRFPFEEVIPPYKSSYDDTQSKRYLSVNAWNRANAPEELKRKWDEIERKRKEMAG